MSQSKWRDRARPIIAKVLAETKGQSESEICKALKGAYPFGERRYHPYKIWLHEIAVQRGKKKLGNFRAANQARHKSRNGNRRIVC